jgi:antitoxin (DNA-binding transcriptional repressor) of toxin-antitoxin stability system
MSDKTLDITQLPDHLLDLLSDIQNQIEVTLTRDGVPLAKVVPLSTKASIIPQPGLYPGSMVMSDDFDEPLPDSFWGL